MAVNVIGGGQRCLLKRCHLEISRRGLQGEGSSPPSVEAILSLANRQRCEQLLRRSGSEPPPSWAVGSERAAVLVPLCRVRGVPCVLFTLRSTRIAAHRGQVSFPGGKFDPTDSDLSHTALREAHEEIGLSSENVSVWGEMQPFVGRQLLAVTPVIADCGELDLSALTVNKSEVAQVFVRRLSELCRPQGYTRFRVTALAGPKTKAYLSSLSRRTYATPVYDAEGGGHRIWGLTAWMLHGVLQLIAPDIYKFRF